MPAAKTAVRTHNEQANTLDDVFQRKQRRKKGGAKMNCNDNDIEKYIDADLEKAIIAFGKYLENQFNVKNRNRCMINAVKMMPELIQRIIKLEKEADWLAMCLEGQGITVMQELQTADMWREEARKAVQSESV